MVSIRRRVAIGLVGLLAASGCSTIHSLGALNALREQLMRKYHDEVIVNLQNSQYLNVVFVNSPLNDQDPSKRLERAQDTARFVALNYEGIKSVEQVWISFMISETRLIIVHYNRIIDSFGFDRNGASVEAETIRNDAEVYDESRKEKDARAPIANYIAATNETEISLTRIQLEGNMNHGVALVPHFKVSGDARSLGTATQPPQYVVFDFASYTDKPVFDGNPPLEIYCDERLALKGQAQLVPATEAGTNESIAQFLTVQVSFKLLRRMGRSRHVRVVLGSKQFQLLPDDITALARIAAYVPDSNDEQ